MLKLVATDLDGTLLHTDGSVTPRTRRVLAALEEQGVLVVFVTGRPIRWMDDLWEHVGGHGVAVCSNGAVVYDVHARRVARARTLDPRVAVEVGGLLRTTIPGTSFAVENAHGFAREPGFMPRVPPPDGVRVAPLEQIAAADTVKLLARHEELDPQRFWERVEELAGDRVTTTWSSTGALVEISAAGVTKASTLQLLCDEHGIGPDEVVAFGDMPNDLPMLAWAGTAYAMANAHPTVSALASRRAPSNEDDGVAAVLEELFGLG
ncbi:MAG TPA: HAD family hydrolase [Nocardioidaceae bacterium]|nr:HAD family hydrolase [Nocardioidaceae bacterium]